MLIKPHDKKNIILVNINYFDFLRNPMGTNDIKNT